MPVGGVVGELLVERCGPQVGVVQRAAPGDEQQLHGPDVVAFGAKASSSQHDLPDLPGARPVGADLGDRGGVRLGLEVGQHPVAAPVDGGGHAAVGRAVLDQDAGRRCVLCRGVDGVADDRGPRVGGVGLRHAVSPQDGGGSASVGL